MPDQAPLQDDNTLQFPEGEDGPLVRPNAPLSVVDLGGGAFAVTEHSPQVPSLAAAFHRTLNDAGVGPDDLLDQAKKRLTEHRGQGGAKSLEAFRKELQHSD